jgi:hypothetical protein
MLNLVERKVTARLQKVKYCEYPVATPVVFMLWSSKLHVMQSYCGCSVYQPPVCSHILYPKLLRWFSATFCNYGLRLIFIGNVNCIKSTHSKSSSACSSYLTLRHLSDILDRSAFSNESRIPAFRRLFCLNSRIDSTPEMNAADRHFISVKLPRNL